MTSQRVSGNAVHTGMCSASHFQAACFFDAKCFAISGPDLFATLDKAGLLYLFTNFTTGSTVYCLKEQNCWLLWILYNVSITSHTFV